PSGSDEADRLTSQNTITPRISPQTGNTRRKNQRNVFARVAVSLALFSIHRPSGVGTTSTRVPLRWTRYQREQRRQDRRRSRRSQRTDPDSPHRGQRTSTRLVGVAPSTSRRSGDGGGAGEPGAVETCGGTGAGAGGGSRQTRAASRSCSTAFL